MISGSLVKTIQTLASGNEIPKAGLTRDMKQSLSDMGFVLRGANQVYVLDNPPELLDKSLISDEISESNRSLLQTLEVHMSLGSTNDFLLEKMKQDVCHGSVCLSEHQTAGKGRRGRSWISPFGSNLYMSIGWQLPGNTRDLSSLSLVVGIQIVQTLHSLGLSDVNLKWPNDLLRKGGKLGGILIEMVHLEASLGMIIGVGINFESGIPKLSEVEQPVGYVPSSHQVGRNRLAGRILNRLLPALDSFQNKGFSSYHPQWEDLNLYQNKPVNIIRGKEVFTGVDRGVDMEGNLLLEQEGEILKFSSGEVSLRPLGPDSYDSSGSAGSGSERDENR